eukprot:GSChrysophyteH1.ASY1.ANO1.2424.1 assembled CDS
MSEVVENKQTLRVGILTAGGLAPCLSACVGFLIINYSKYSASTGRKVEVVLYHCGYSGLLKGDSTVVLADEKAREHAEVLLRSGGSPIGNSRVKLTNVKDCLKRGFVSEGELPLEKAAKQLQKDNVSILHTCGGDDTTLQAAEVAKYLSKNEYNITVVGLPKTIDNDIAPVKLSLGALTAAEEGAKFFENVVNESSANPRMLIIHECMGRDCGFLTAKTAAIYRQRMNSVRCDTLYTTCPANFFLTLISNPLPYMAPLLDINIEEEVKRLRMVMDTFDCVNMFISEGANVEQIVEEMRSAGDDIPLDAFGHVKLDAVNPGQWFSKQFAGRIGAEKVLVQKSGYMARSARANEEDLALISRCCELATECGIKKMAGCIGEDEKQNGQLRAIEFSRIRGARPFDTKTRWYVEMQEDLAHSYFSHPERTIVPAAPRERGY